MSPTASPPPLLPTVAELVEAALPRARWFAGKSRAARVRTMIPLPWIESDDLPAVRFEIAEISPIGEPDSVEHYLIPLCYRPAADPSGPGLGVAADPELGPVTVHDATRDPYAGDVLLRFVSADNEVSGEESRVVRSHAVDTGRLRVGLPPRRFGGEQSNTSVMYGDVAMLKFFRRLEFGKNLDIEVHHELAGGPAAPRLAGLYGWIDAEWVDSVGVAREADFGMLVEQLPQALDGWEFAVDHVTNDEDFRAHAAELGTALRQVHEGLAEAFGTATAPGTDEATNMRRRLADTIAQVDQVAPLQGSLDSRLAALDGLDYPVQRIHGDFHLGQVLLVRGSASPNAQDATTGRAWKIIDFEGEPLKSLAERRAYDTVWRDVAGMLRSFDYAAAYAVRERGAGHEQASEWARLSTNAFVSAYAGRDLDVTEQSILQAYQIDKAAYECRYEAGNRPDWLPIPLTALAALAETATFDTFHGGTDER